MDILLQALEDWRLENGYSKSDVARMLKCKSPQTYTNWLARGSLPKDYFYAASALIGKESMAVQPPTDDSDIASMLAELGDTAKVEAFSAICRQLSPRDSLRLALILLRQVEGEL